MSDEIAPLVPADVDLSGYEFMPLYGDYLFGSNFNSRVSDAAWRVAVTLWWAAWKQVPAASLPADDAALTKLADLGRDVKTFRKLKDQALHGFILCDDGRLYHPRLARWALEAWERRTEHRESSESKAARQKRWRERCQALGEQLRQLGVTPPRGASLETLERLLEASTPAPITSTGDATRDDVEIGKKGSEAKRSEAKRREATLSNRDVGVTPPPGNVNGAAGKSAHPNGEEPPWWKTPEGVDATAKTMGMNRRVNESDSEWKDRVYTAVTTKRRVDSARGKAHH